jgi:hypothetical protein
MLRRILFSVFMVFLGATQLGAAPTVKQENEKERVCAFSARVLLKVVHPVEARKKIVGLIDSLGGFPSVVTDQKLIIRVPPEKFPGLIRDIGQYGVVVEKTMQREDITEKLAQLGGRLRSKQDILEKLRSFFDDSNVKATLQIEKNMTQLVIELEKVKGQLRLAIDKARFATIEVAFRFRRRDRIVYVNSPFQWLNSVDLDRFLAEF